MDMHDRKIYITIPPTAVAHRKWHELVDDGPPAIVTFQQARRQGSSVGMHTSIALAHDRSCSPQSAPPMSPKAPHIPTRPPRTARPTAGGAAAYAQPDEAYATAVYLGVGRKEMRNKSKPRPTPQPCICAWRGDVKMYCGAGVKRRKRWT